MPGIFAQRKPQTCHKSEEKYLQTFKYPQTFEYLQTWKNSEIRTAQTLATLWQNRNGQPVVRPISSKWYKQQSLGDFQRKIVDLIRIMSGNPTTKLIWTKSRQIDANKNNPKAIVKDKLSI